MRFLLLWVAVGCVIGCARSDGDSNNPGLGRIHALAEKSGEVEFKHASLKGAREFSQKPSVDPIAFFRGRSGGATKNPDLESTDALAGQSSDDDSGNATPKTEWRMSPWTR